MYGWNCAHRRFGFCYKCIKYIEIAWQKPKFGFKNKSKEGQITNLKSEINIGKCWVRVLSTNEGIKFTSVWKHAKSIMKQSILRMYLPLYRSRHLPFNLGYIIEWFFFDVTLCLHFQIWEVICNGKMQVIWRKMSWTHVKSQR